MMRPLKSILVSLWCASACFGQEVWYLSPRAFHVDPAAKIEIQVVRSGQDGSIERDADKPINGAQPRAGDMPFPSEIASHVFVRGGGRQWNLHHPEPIQAEGAGRAWIQLPNPEVGVAMIGLECDPVTETFTAEQLRTFINDRAPAFEALAIPDGDDIRVRVVRCAKTLVRIDDGKTGEMASPIPASKAGQRNEIRLNGDPTLLRVDGGEGAASEIPLRLYADWHSRKGVTFTATRADTEVSTLVDVNEYGNGPMLVDAAGVWQIEFHYLIDLRDQAGLDDADPQGLGEQAAGELNPVSFELHSATLTFMIDEGDAR